MADLGEGPIDADLRRVLDEIDQCLTMLREKLGELDRVKGAGDDDG